MNASEACKCCMVGSRRSFQKEHKVNIPFAVKFHGAGRIVPVHVRVKHNLEKGSWRYGIYSFEVWQFFCIVKGRRTNNLVRQPLYFVENGVWKRYIYSIKLNLVEDIIMHDIQIKNRTIVVTPS